LSGLAITVYELYIARKSSEAASLPALQVTSIESFQPTFIEFAVTNFSDSDVTFYPSALINQQLVTGDLYTIPSRSSGIVEVGFANPLAPGQSYSLTVYCAGDQQGLQPVSETYSASESL